MSLGHGEVMTVRACSAFLGLAFHSFLSAENRLDPRAHIVTAVFSRLLVYLWETMTHWNGSASRYLWSFCVILFLFCFVFFWKETENYSSVIYNGISRPLYSMKPPKNHTMSTLYSNYKARQTLERQHCLNGLP